MGPAGLEPRGWWRVPTACRAASILCALGLLLTTGAVTPRPLLPREPSFAVAADRPASSPTLAVDPSSWEMEDGGNASFTAAWVDLPPGCLLTPGWYRWAEEPEAVDGSLADANTSEAVLLAPTVGAGTAVLEVRAAATLRCGGNLTAEVGNATVNVTIAAPVEVEELRVEPDPLDPGESASLLGSVAGGTAPYRLQVSWGDGNLTEAQVSGPGTFAVPYRYAQSGTFDPVVLATDADGRTGASAPVEAVHVGEGFLSAIAASTNETEFGVPVTFTVSTLHDPANFSSTFWCDDASATAAENASDLLFTCTFERAGTFQVGFEAYGALPPSPVTSSTYNERVVPPPVLGFPVVAPAGEVDSPADVVANVSGGVPPFSVRWSLVGTATAGNLTLAGDGSFDVPVTPGSAGRMTLSVQLADAFGQVATAEEPLAVAPALVVGADAVGTVAVGAILLNVSGSAIEGIAPYGWAVVPAAAPANGTNLSGTLTAPGAFAWNASYLTEGPLAVTVVVVDADGAFAEENLSVRPVAPLEVRAAAASTGPGDVNLTFTVVGGVAPYLYRWQGCTGAVWNGSDPAAGSFALTEPITTVGLCAFDLAVIDAFGLGVNASAAANLTAPSAPVPPTGSSAGAKEVGAAALLTVGAGVAVVIGLRRRRPRAVPTPPDPVAVLREVIEASDGVDRGLVEMLAQERGVPLETVRSTLERLKADGSVRSGRGSDGEEVLAWSPPPLP